MRIEKLETRLVNVPLRTEQRTSFSTRRAMTQCLVQATADDGRVGWGEASGGAGGWAPACRAIVEAMRDVVIGRAPDELPAMRAELFDARYWKNAGRLAHMSFGAVETALLDLDAQRRGLPLWRLLGEKLRDEVDVFAFLDRSRPVDALARQAVEAEARGFRVLYLKVGLDDAADLACVRAVRGAIRPATRLRVDANGAWPAPHAVRMIEALAPFGLDFVEQPTPLDDLAALAEVRRAVAVPICANEVAWHPAEWREVLRQAAADVLCVNVAWCGGPTRMLEVARMAAARGVGVVRHTIDIGINDYAALHVLAVAPGAADGHQFMATHLGDDVLAGGPLVSGGRPLPVPAAPGLGAPVSEAKVRELEERFRIDGNATAFSWTKGADR
jgi:L-alanine-DL-glutamate epimerase-like enolase superfamily enzyme